MKRAKHHAFTGVDVSEQIKIAPKDVARNIFRHCGAQHLSARFIRLIVWIGLNLLPFFSFAQSTQPQDIYVFNQPFTGRSLSIHGTLYVSVEALAKALGLSYEKQGAMIMIGDLISRAPQAKITLNGKPFPETSIDKNGVTLVPLKAFVTASGNECVFNKETKIVDVIR